MLSSITQRLRLPAICTLCKHYYRGPDAVCEDCINLFCRTEPACHYCAYPLPEPDFPVCGVCAREKPYFDKALIAYRYEEPLRSLIHQFKYQQKLYLSSLFVRLIMEALRTDKEQPQCLIPMPMHPQRINDRGFNQAALLAQGLGKKLKIPYLLNHCKKIKNTQPQAKLDHKQRKKNLYNAFAVPQMDFEHVAIIDDLLTTGSTANELAKQMKKSGAKRVDIWCCARAVLN